jgi:hypothetical protein
VRKFVYAVAAVLALSPFIALASASTPAGAAVTHPAAALTGDYICESSGNPCVGGGSPANLNVGNLYSQGSCSTYESESYCQLVAQNGQCLSWDDISGNPVDLVDCNGKIRQDWWWSGVRFRNLYATELGSAYSDGVCMNADAADQVDLYYCDVPSSEWEWSG